MISCKNSGHEPENHFAGAGKMVAIGSGTEREINDYQLSRYACYLTAMNGDPRKPEISAAQTYFAIKTREAEVNLANTQLALTQRRLIDLEAAIQKVINLVPTQTQLDDVDRDTTSLVIYRLVHDAGKFEALMREVQQQLKKKEKQPIYQKQIEELQVLMQHIRKRVIRLEKVAVLEDASNELLLDLWTEQGDLAQLALAQLSTLALPQPQE